MKILATHFVVLLASFAFSATDPEPDIDHGPYSCTFDSGQSTREECRCDNCQIQTAICNGFDAGPARPGYGPWFPADIPVSSEAMDLIGRMLQSNPVTRITAREALAHPWLNGSAPTQPLVAGLFTNLGQIAAQSKLKKLLLECLSTDLFSALELKQISNAFEEIDSNGDGHITLEELNTVLARMAADGTPGASKTGEQVRNLMALGDIDNDGTLSFKELLAHASSRKLIAKEERLRSLFELIDEDGNGRITLEEIDKLTHGQIPRAELESMIAEVDRDNDQTLDYDEFVHVFVNAGNPLFDGILN
jgi:Ca2+-binding EF-hand superfamily protein